MTSEQNAISWAKDQLERGLLTADQANIEIVRMMGVRVIAGKLHSGVRKSLMQGVKDKQLGRLPKKGLAPEVFYHINSRANAIDEQRRIAQQRVNVLKNVLA